MAACSAGRSLYGDGLAGLIGTVDHAWSYVHNDPPGAETIRTVHNRLKRLSGAGQFLRRLPGRAGRAIVLRVLATLPAG